MLEPIITMFKDIDPIEATLVIIASLVMGLVVWSLYQSMLLNPKKENWPTTKK